MLIYTENTTPRLDYITRVFLGQICGINFRISNNAEEVQNLLTEGAVEAFPILNYSGKQLRGTIQIHPAGLLDESGISQFNPSFEYSEEWKLKLFLTEFDGLGFDVLSASFFLLSRYEEYWKFDPDKHGRYPSGNSLLHKLGVLHLPLVNIWAKVLVRMILDRYPDFKIDKRVFKALITMDVDHAWAFKNKGVVRNLGGLLKKMFIGEWEDVKLRLATGFGAFYDPFDSYDYILDLSRKTNAGVKFFILSGSYGGYDNPVSINNYQFRLKIKELSQFSEIGLHPSYASNSCKEVLKKEFDVLRAILQRPVIESRQHFLKLVIPDTYRNLIENGVLHDYSLGYADAYGFRAGCCSPFLFYDLLQEKITDLTIHPFAFMDGALNEYLKLSVSEAIEVVKTLKTSVQEVNGQWSSVWHNHTIVEKAEWKEWRQVFEAAYL